MMKRLFVFCVNYFLLCKIGHAQYSKRGWPNAPPTSSAKQPIAPIPAPISPAPTNVPTFERITPKCYPETASVYFLPAPPSSPKITVLDLNSKDLPSHLNLNREVASNNINEVPSSLPFPPSNKITNRVAFPPPPPCSAGFPDLIDEVPNKIQDRFTRLTESDEKSTVCESCARMIKKLPIFNFDQELLNGFLAGIGI